MRGQSFYPALQTLARYRLTSEYADAGRQCLHCRFYLEFRLPEGSDYGCCLNRDADSNGLVVFEHFGCQHHKYRNGTMYLLKGDGEVNHASPE